MGLDERIFHAVNSGWTCSALDWWSALVRATELWLVPALVAFALLLWRGSPRARTAALVGVAAFLIGDAVFVRAGKAIVQRPRPVMVVSLRSVRLARVTPRVKALVMPLDVSQQGPDPQRSARSSLPSGHVWNTFAIATVIALAWRRRGWLAYLPAAGVAYARVHAGLHWPSDVVLSAILSVPATIGLVFVLEHAARRLVPRRPFASILRADAPLPDAR